jgi:hypothetical protein
MVISEEGAKYTLNRKGLEATKTIKENKEKGDEAYSFLFPLLRDKNL